LDSHEGSLGVILLRKVVHTGEGRLNQSSNTTLHGETLPSINVDRKMANEGS